jgi:hypothetical protein
MTQATAASDIQPATRIRTPYRVRVHNIEACNCSHGCNCQFGGFPDRGACEAVIGGEVIEGRFGDIDLAGTRYVIAFMYPGAIHQGSGRLALFIDERATPAQADAIATILSGQAGGMPWEALAGTVGSLDGPNRVPIEMTVNGTKSSIRIPGILELQQAPIRDAVSGQEKEIQIVYPKGGFMWNTGNIGTSTELQADFGSIQFRHPGGYACYATPTYTNQA